MKLGLRWKGHNRKVVWFVSYNSFLNVKALVGTFNEEKALVGTFSVIVKCSLTRVCAAGPWCPYLWSRLRHPSP